MITIAGIILGLTLSNDLTTDDKGDTMRWLIPVLGFGIDLIIIILGGLYLDILEYFI